MNAKVYVSWTLEDGWRHSFTPLEDGATYERIDEVELPDGWKMVSACGGYVTYAEDERGFMWKVANTRTYDTSTYTLMPVDVDQFTMPKPEPFKVKAIIEE